MNEVKSEHMLRSASVVYGLLPRIAGGVVGLSALAYFAGLREASAYYDELGAPWALWLLSSAQIMHKSIGIVSIIAYFGFFSLILLLQKSKSADDFRRWTLYIGVGALLFYGIELALEQWISPFAAYVGSIFVGCLWATAAGFMVGELIGRLSETDLRWDIRHLWLVYFVLVVGLWNAPEYIGRARAKIDGNPQLSKLPTVRLSKSLASDRWQLVSILSGQALVSRLAQKREQRTFKIVATSEIDEVLTGER